MDRGLLVVLLVAAGCGFEHGSLSSGGGTDARTDVPPDDGTFTGQVVADEFSDAETSIGDLSATRSHLVGTGQHCFMLVGVSLASGTTQVSTITYGTSALTRVGGIDAQQGRVELWQLLAPPSGSASITVTLTNTATTSVIGIGSFSGVDQTSPVGPFMSAIGGSGGPTLSLASGPGHIVESVVMWHGNNSSLTTSSALQWRREVNNEIGVGALDVGAANVTAKYTVTSAASAPWAIAAVTIHPGS